MWKPRGLHDALDPVEDDDLLQMDRGEKELLLDLRRGKIDRPSRVHGFFGAMRGSLYGLQTLHGLKPAAKASSRLFRIRVQFRQSYDGQDGR